MDIQLNDETLESLSALAGLKDMSMEDTAAALIEEHVQRLARYERERVEDLDSTKAIKNGEYVTNADVHTWLESWGTETELPCPIFTK